MTPLEMRDHILELAADRDIVVEWNRIPLRLDEFNAFARPGLIEVYDPTQTDGTEFSPGAAYFTALHELGHHYRGHVDLPRDPMHYRDQLLDFEAEAWDWAMDTIQVAPDEIALRAAEHGLDSYAADVGTSGWYALGPGGPTYDALRQRIREAYGSAVPDLAVAA